MNHPDTPKRLVRAATTLFAARGYDAASVRDITRRARANLGAVTYHFGSKADLYAAVVEGLTRALADRLAAAAAPPGPAAARLTRMVHGIFAFFADHPEAPAILLDALAHGGPPAAALPQLRRNLETVGRVVHEGQAAGELRAVDPALAAFTLLSQCVWFVVAGATIARVALGPFADPDRVARHIATVVVRAFGTEGAQA
jgi:AcrR family transcriptional regulator